MRRGPMADVPSDVTQTIDALSEAFVRRLNDGEVGELVDDFYAADAVLFLPDHAMVSGRQVVGTILGTAVAEGIGDLSMETVRIEASGDLAYRSGRYRLGKPRPDRGKFIEVHRRQLDGSWRCVVDVFDSDGEHGHP
jgi:ketosteroid isomerase-like protein